MQLRTPLEAVTVAAAAGCAVLALAGPAAAKPVSTSVHMVAICNSNNQTCPVQTTQLDGSGTDVKVTFKADGGHCSDIEVTVSVDGRSVASATLGPGGIVSSSPFPLAAGTHEYAVNATGRVSGCNTGNSAPGRATSRSPGRSRTRWQLPRPSLYRQAETPTATDSPIATSSRSSPTSF